MYGKVILFIACIGCVVVQGSPTPSLWPGTRLQPVHNQATEVVGKCVHVLVHMRSCISKTIPSPPTTAAAYAGLPRQKCWRLLL